MSFEDINRDLELVEWMAHHARLLCLTEGELGAVLHWHGDRRRFRPPSVVEEVDATGAGDIFAAAFFTRLYSTRDPWEGSLCNASRGIFCNACGTAWYSDP